MILYAESNFVLEMALLQEEHAACDCLFQLAEQGKLELVLPAYCFTEPFETITRHHLERRATELQLSKQFGQLARTISYQSQRSAMDSVTELLVKSVTDEDSNLNLTISKLIAKCAVIDLTGAIVTDSMQFRKKYDFDRQDAVVYASILSDLRKRNPSDACFVTRNRDDFKDPDIHSELGTFNCKILYSFVTTVQYLKSRGVT